MKLVFIDAEFTGEHARATLVSLGLVTLEGDTLYVTLNDYDRDQVTDWLRENVLAQLDESHSVSSDEAYRSVSKWLQAYAENEQIRLVSAGLGSDVILLSELYKFGYPDRKYFHALHCLPPYLNHAKFLDLNTLFQITGHNPDMDREAFIDVPVAGRRHHSLYDAMVARQCFLKLLSYGEMHHFLACADQIS